MYVAKSKSGFVGAYLTWLISVFVVVTVVSSYNVRVGKYRKFLSYRFENLKNLVF